METTFQLSYALDTFYFLICGALVMWMAAGFAMLEAGLVRAKNTTEILTKNVALYAISCTMYMIVGYSIMYKGTASEWFFLGEIMGSGAVEGGEDNATYAPSADFFFQVVFVATAMSIVSGAVAERMKLWAFLAVRCHHDWCDLPDRRWLDLGRKLCIRHVHTELSYSFSDYAGSGIVHMAGAVSCACRCDWCWALVKVNTVQTVLLARFLVLTCRWRLSVPSSCGWVGLASTVVQY